MEKCLFRQDGKELRVTMSFGLAEVLGGEDGAMLTARANKALFAAKEDGRNCAYRHDGETVERLAGDDGHVVPQHQGQAESEPRPCEPEKSEKAGPTPDAAATEAKPDLPRGAERDAVAGLPCHAIFCQQVRARTAEWKRGGPTFSVALMEVDQYRQAGKQDGQPIREAATLTANSDLTATVREMDSVGYYGPGCFALLLPTAGLADAIAVAERLRQGFTQYSLSRKARNRGSR